SSPASPSRSPARSASTARWSSSPATCRSRPRSPPCSSSHASRSSTTRRRRRSRWSSSASRSSPSSPSTSSNAGARATMAEHAPSALSYLRAHEDPPIVRRLLIGLALAVMIFLVVIPLVVVFVEAFSKGLAVYWDNLVHDPDTLHSIKLTLLVAPVAVLLNLVFGIAGAWAIARFRFPGRAFLTA